MDDRSERLRKRRKQSTGRPGRPDADDSSGASGTSDDSSGTSEATETSEPSKPSEPSHGGGADGRAEDAEDGDAGADEDGSIPVKEQQTGTYMYLPETQVKRLRRQYNVLKAEYEFEYDEEFEKNRHFYPLVVRHGLERLDELDTAEIRARLEEFYE
jgi:hypothetical protein